MKTIIDVYSGSIVIIKETVLKTVENFLNLGYKR